MAQSSEPSFLFGTNTAFIAELYEQYLGDPSSVDASWKQFFEELKDDAAAILTEVKGPSWQRTAKRIIASEAEVSPAGKTNGKGASAAAAVKVEATGGVSAEELRKATTDSIRALMLIRSYRVRGHLNAQLDPLGLIKRAPHPELDPKSYGFTEADMDRRIFIDRVLGLDNPTLREIVETLQQTYCGSVGLEFMHIQDPTEKQWLQEHFEGRNPGYGKDTKKAILERLTAAESFERFLDRRFTGTKRFGLEGGETMIPALEQVIWRAGELGVKEIVLGMAHRGRLNTLANVMGKRFAAIVSEFQGTPPTPDSVQGSGDVKYHLGTSSDREFEGNVVHLSLTANPSHLEVVDPVVLGKVRAKQNQRGDIVERGSVAGLLIHGDAAFAGQGLVAETLMMADLKGYRVGGTIHFVINNQIGFTTSPQYARSGPYCSDVAKMTQAPVFHVNGDDPEAVVWVSGLAMEFRQKFKKDVVVDMFCYRRHGHNESDEPAFTQPLMYRKIATQPTTRQVYADRLVREGVLSQEEADGLVEARMQTLEGEFEAAKSFKANKADWLEGAWAGFEPAKSDDERKVKTGVSLDLLREIGAKLTSVPEGFNLNRKLVRQLQEKAKMFETGEGFDWATAEALAFGTLALEGNGIRLSGQDVGRGTFSHRHAVLVDQENEQAYVPLNNLREGQGQVDIFDSPLSEAAVLGFDYGYSLAEPRVLVLWEGQFGDFANGAQVVIDQFICSAESKWLRMSGITMLLPHGYEGQGPEHSSARLERYLQLCAEDNMQVCNFSTPANYFHALRRQQCRNFRKPLIVMSPKSMLRAKLSKLEEMGPGTGFRRIIGETDTLIADGEVKRVVLSTGKICHELLAKRTERGIKDVALVRVEQLYPFPLNSLAKELKRYPNAEVVWCQEEPKNMGAWTFVDHRIETVMRDLGGKAVRPLYAGRPEAASPATGSNKRHVAEQAALIDAALTVA